MKRVIGMDGNFTYSLTHSLDPSLRWKLFLHIYTKLTKFDLGRHEFEPHPGWKFLFFFSTWSEVTFFWIHKKSLHLVKTKSYHIALPSAFRIYRLAHRSL